MNILAFDTSTSILSVAAQNSKGRSSASILDVGLRHGELLSPEINRILQLLEIKISSLDLIICTRGPGSFTGLRIGMATAKGLSSGSGVPMVSVNLPDVLVRPFELYDGPVVTVIDAKKNRFYGAAYRNGKRTSEYFDLEADSIIRSFAQEQPALITGPDTELFRNRVSDLGLNEIRQSQPVLIFDLIKEGLQKYKRDGADKPGQGPLYIRKSDAELSLEIRHGTG